MKYVLFAMFFIGGGVCFAQDEAFGVDVLQLQISEMEKVIAAQTNTIEKLNNKLDKMQTQIDNFKADVEIRFEDMAKKTVEEAVPAKASDAVPSQIKTEEAVSDVKSLYDSGMEFIRLAKYPEAQMKFEEFLKIAPKDNLAGNAKYWLGESFYARGDYANAAVVFAQGFQEYPKSIKAPDNLLKLGISMKALKKNAEACTAFTSIASEFPKADKKITEKAKKEAEKLKCK